MSTFTNKWLFTILGQANIICVFLFFISLSFRITVCFECYLFAIAASSQFVILFHLLFADAQMASRQILMKKTSVSQLLVTPIVNITVTSLLNCHVQCLAIDTCAYVTFTQSTSMCTLYSTADMFGTTSVNVTRLQVYMLHSKTITVSCTNE